MKKRSGKFYFILTVVIAAAFFGLGFVYSQGTGTTLPSTGTVPNPGHVSEQILCNGCISNANIASSAVIDPGKINGINGHFVQNLNLGGNGGTAVITLSSTWGVTPNWISKRIRTLCDPTQPNEITAFGGITQFTSANSYQMTFNQYTVTLWAPGASGLSVSGLPGTDWIKIYQRNTYTNGVPNTGESLYIRVNPSDTTKLELGQIGPGLSWSCLIEVGQNS